MCIGGEGSGLLCKREMYGEAIFPFSDPELLVRDLLLLIMPLFSKSL